MWLRLRVPLRLSRIFAISTRPTTPIFVTELPRMASRGLRVLGVAKSSFDGPEWPEKQHDFAFDLLGWSVSLTRYGQAFSTQSRRPSTAGIKVAMITGDHAVTARAIAQQSGLAGGCCGDHGRRDCDNE